MTKKNFFFKTIPYIWKDILKIAKGNKCQSKAQFSHSFAHFINITQERQLLHGIQQPPAHARAHRGNQQPKRIPKNNNNKSDLKIYIFGPIVELVLQNKYVCQNYFGI